MLKKAVTNDRSAPIIGKNSERECAPIGSASPTLGQSKTYADAALPISGLAPPVLGRARSNSDQGDGSGGILAVDSVSKLGGLFAGGMPKLRKTGKSGIDTRGIVVSSCLPIRGFCVFMVQY